MAQPQPVSTVGAIIKNKKYKTTGTVTDGAE